MSESQAQETTTQYAVEGMTCGHCASAVTEEVMALDSVSNVDVQLASGAPSTVTVTSGSEVSESDIAGALAEAGNYRLVSGH
ncbi:MAG: heavy-metal-associated domain-containing protein [Ornithinimicrobium sp.]